VKDLTAVEYGVSDGSTTPCCEVFSLSGGCISLQELLLPSADPTPIPPSPPRHGTVDSEEVHKRSRRRLTATNLEAPELPTVIDDVDESDQNFDETYVLTRMLNQGSISCVWECVHRRSGTLFAAKIIDRRGLSQREDDAVCKEISMLKTLSPDAPGVIHFRELFDEVDKYYIVTDYAAGGNLLTRIVQKKRLLEEDVQNLARAILHGLDHIHSRDTCHRNLKPENILLCGYGFSEVMIADFGLATRLYTDSQGKRALLTDRCGTSSYAAPECIQRQPYDQQCDMWSLGVILFSALVGHLPFVDSNRRNLHKKICKADYVFRVAEWELISRDAKRFISSLLHVDPQVRMTAAEALQHPWIEKATSNAESGVGDFANNKQATKKIRLFGGWRSGKGRSLTHQSLEGSKIQTSTDPLDKSAHSSDTASVTSDSPCDHVSRTTKAEF